MKKGRISKKNPNRILKAIESRVSPSKELSNPSKQLINSLHFQQIRHSHKLPLPQYSSNTFRYRVVQQSLDFQKRKQGYSPRNYIGSRSLEKSSQETATYRKNRAVLQEMAHRYKNKSPYLQKNADHKSQKKLIFGNRNFTQSNHGLSKQMKTIRFNSLQEKSESPDSKKLNNSQDILKEAKKLMVAGQSRKSLFILKPLLAKEPQNLSAYHMAAINLYNIGDYKKSGEYLDHIIEISKDYSPNVYILRGKVYLKQKKFDDCLFKYQQCRKLFPSCQALFLELGDFYIGLKRYKQALSFYQEAEKLGPQSIKIQQKLLFVLQNMLQYERIVKIIDKLSKFGHPQKYSSLKSKSLIKLSRFSQIISGYKNNPGSVTSLAYAYSLYKTKDSLKSYLILDSNLHEQENKKDSIRLMLLILCTSNDFYEAYHLLQRCQHLNINKDQLKCQICFIDGAIYLMKKNIVQGVKSLTHVQQLVLNNTKGQDILSIQNELNNYMRKSVNMFLGYGYLCLGNYKKSLSLYKLQLQKYKATKSDGLQYNILLNQGYFYSESKDIKRSKQIFQSLTKLNPLKIQPYICLAILNINLYFKQRQETGYQNFILLQQAKQLLKNQAPNAVSLQNNLGAIFFYHKSVLHGYMTQWREALACVDEAIEKSEENYWRYYYLRATILASIHNFPEAINDCTAAINLKDSEPLPYLLRSTCFQIEGEGNYAFKDLQSYIALKPQDKGIHKYAGKLLFENGAFQDALGAFSHQMVQQVIQNQDVFLTKSKTYFLLGRFQEASIEMDRVSKINPERKYANFDSKMMKVLDTLLRNQNFRELTSIIDSIYQEYKSVFVKWQIFKKTEQHTLKSVCYFYEGQYKKTIQQLERAINAKQKTILKQTLIDGSTRQDQKDTLLYTNQMKFNISLCHLMLGDLDRATDQASLMCFYSNDPFNQPYKRYMGILYGKKVNSETEEIKVEIFPNRNKISNFLKEIKICVHGQKIRTKLCIPFPKVQPPQIFPKFDETLLQKFSILKIQRKPEAPWICRQNNTIKFTNKIQKYSRLEIEESVGSVTEKDIDNSHISADSVIERRRTSRKSMPKLLENEQNSEFL